jgi:hypothetical protein
MPQDKYCYSDDRMLTIDEIADVIIPGGYIKNIPHETINELIGKLRDKNSQMGINYLIDKTDFIFFGYGK